MNLHFHKYQGTGNDFVMIDDRQAVFPDQDKALIARLCHRRFGIGADGLILLRNHPTADFRMVYFNADGAESSMCGNGGRCVAAFALALGVVGDSSADFVAVDGPHKAIFEGNQVSLQMSNVESLSQNGIDWVLDTGSPHYVRFVDDVAKVDVLSEGRAIRCSPSFREKGINVNFVAWEGGALRVATYERGVEDETLSCGTGVTAAALVAAKRQGRNSGRIPIISKGGTLSVSFRRAGGGFQDIWLKGGAELVFSGTIRLDAPALGGGR